MTELLTQKHLKEQLDYNQETGLWKWKFLNGSRAKTGWFSGTKERSGYLCIKIFGKSYKAHRLAWLYVYGDWPPSEMDHLNGNKADNRMVNLRATDKSINVFRSGLRSSNTSGTIGIYFDSRDWVKHPWIAIITRNRARMAKAFKTKEEAAKWRREMELELFNEFAQASKE